MVNDFRYENVNEFSAWLAQDESKSLAKKKPEHFFNRAGDMVTESFLQYQYLDAFKEYLNHQTIVEAALEMGKKNPQDVLSRSFSLLADFPPDMRVAAFNILMNGRALNDAARKRPDAYFQNCSDEFDFYLDESPMIDSFKSWLASDNTREAAKISPKLYFQTVRHIMGLLPSDDAKHAFDKWLDSAPTHQASGIKSIAYFRMAQYALSEIHKEQCAGAFANFLKHDATTRAADAKPKSYIAYSKEMLDEFLSGDAARIAYTQWLDSEASKIAHQKAPFEYGHFCEEMEARFPDLAGVAEHFSQEPDQHPAPAA